jgi:calcium-translocating P-type ATPase
MTTASRHGSPSTTVFVSALDSAGNSRTVTTHASHEAAESSVVPDPSMPVERLLRDLRASVDGLDGRDARRRLERFGPNQLSRHKTRSWPREIRDQFTHPLALLLLVAAALAFVAGTAVLGWAILAVVVLNAAFAFAQEQQAERAVETLQTYVPSHASVIRDGSHSFVSTTELVPGDIIDLVEGQRVPADARLLSGELAVDLATLTGESVPQTRTAAPSSALTPLLQASDLVFSGTTCLSGTGRAVVYATGDHTELGRIASLSQTVERDPSPLELQVKRVARLIAVVAVVVGLAFLPLGMLAGLTAKDAFLFAVGLLVANVPEGLLPTITLALAVGVRALAQRGAVVKRLSAVETLGSTTVICSDKTGTITRNQMAPVLAWSGGRAVAVGPSAGPNAAVPAFAAAMASCVTVTGPLEGSDREDATELAVAKAAELLGRPYAPDARDRSRLALHPFQAALRLMSTVDTRDGQAILSVKGAPESVLPRCDSWLDHDGRPRSFDRSFANQVAEQVHEMAARGLRVLAVADRPVGTGEAGAERDLLERRLRFLGIVALQDPPRPEVAQAVATCHQAGLRVHIVTGDSGDTAAEIAREVGIGWGRPRVITGTQLATMDDAALVDAANGAEVVFARTSPEDKLRIADALMDSGHVVAMTGDGVNDAPALRRADIGVAMGRNGTDVAREAATAVLSDDNFATIVTAVQEGRRVYDNVRKFILYIFAHAVPEIVPFLIFALSGGAVPLPLTVSQILAIDLGTETLPALALGREAVEPGLMSRPPRPRDESVVTRALLVRAWGLLGVVSALLAMAAFFVTLHQAGWQPGDPTAAGSPLHHAYLEATTATFAAIVSCQVGVALAARTDLASLRDVGFWSNPLLLWGIAFEIAFTAMLVYLPVFNRLVGTAPLPWDVVTLLVPFPVIVWGVDEWRRARRRTARPAPTPGVGDGEESHPRPAFEGTARRSRLRRGRTGTRLRAGLSAPPRPRAPECLTVVRMSEEE